LLTRLRRATRASDEADQLLAKFPNAEAAHRAAGEAYLAAARYKHALACFDWIVERSTDVLAQLKRGFALAALGDYGNSTAAFAKAKNADPHAVEKFCISLSGRSEAPSVLDPRAIHLWALYMAQCQCDWGGRDVLADALRHAGESAVAANEPALARTDPLFDTPGRVRALEEALLGMRENHDR
jgi:tetratricopeptide (TPR) repeat protein